MNKQTYRSFYVYLKYDKMKYQEIEKLRKPYFLKKKKVDFVGVQSHLMFGFVVPSESLQPATGGSP